ncbi:hypothetical protein ACP275_06G067500 [Erythranthe tilingii]
MSKLISRSLLLVVIVLITLTSDCSVRGEEENGCIICERVCMSKIYSQCDVNVADSCVQECRKIIDPKKYIRSLCTSDTSNNKYCQCIWHC